ncbi:hypothetical protein ACQKML_19770 [Peribacillus frigoritolerans]
MNSGDLSAGAEDQTQVLARLLKSQEDIGNAEKPVNGEKVVTNLRICLRSILLLRERLLMRLKVEMMPW